MTPLFKKLNFKNHLKILAINAPSSFDGELIQMEPFTKVYKHEKQLAVIDFALAFVTKQTEIDKTISTLFPKLIGDAVLWFCYPKGTSKKYQCDFNRDTGWSGLGAYNLEGVRQVAIDEDWSALRFRKIEFIKKLARREGVALSEEGKMRTKKGG